MKLRKCLKGPNFSVVNVLTVLKYPRMYFYPFDESTRDKFSWNMSLLLRSEILELFVKSLTNDNQYSNP